jgi:hypothetical protein
MRAAPDFRAIAPEIRALPHPHSGMQVYATVFADFFVNEPIRPGSGTVVPASQAQEETQMDFGLGLLTFGTLGFVVAFGYLSVRSMQKLKDSGAPKSSLSRDGIEERRLAATRNA